VLTFYRWYVLMRAHGLPVRLSDALQLGAVGFFFNTFLPGSVGGDIIKAAVLAGRRSRPTSAVATILIDRAIGLWALVGLAGLTGAAFRAAGLLQGAAERPSKIIVATAGIVASVSLLVWVGLGLLPCRAERFASRLSQLSRVGNAAAESWQAVRLYRRRPRSVLVAVLLSGVSHAGFVLTFYFCALTLVPPREAATAPSLVEHFLIVPVGLIIRAAPVFPGGAGIGELGFAELYRWFGCPASNGILAAMVHRLVHWLVGLLGYLVYLSGKPAT
jgi:uncharacterized protein (TIRG00374 family)